MYISFQVIPELRVFKEEPDIWFVTCALIAWLIISMPWFWPSTDFDFSIDEFDVALELIVPRAGVTL